MSDNKIIVPPQGFFSVDSSYAFSEIDISDNAWVGNGAQTFGAGLPATSTTDFVFLGAQGSLSTSGAPYFQGTISNFQAGDHLLLLNPGVPFNVPNNPI